MYLIKQNPSRIHLMPFHAGGRWYFPIPFLGWLLAQGRRPPE